MSGRAFHSTMPLVHATAYIKTSPFTTPLPILSALQHRQSLRDANLHHSHTCNFLPARLVVENSPGGWRCEIFTFHYQHQISLDHCPLYRTLSATRTTPSRLLAPVASWLASYGSLHGLYLRLPKAAPATAPPLAAAQNTIKTFFRAPEREGRAQQSPTKFAAAKKRQRTQTPAAAPETCKFQPDIPEANLDSFSTNREVVDLKHLSANTAAAPAAAPRPHHCQSGRGSPPSASLKLTLQKKPPAAQAKTAGDGPTSYADSRGRKRARIHRHPLHQNQSEKGP